MNQGRHRRRSCHGVGEPGMQRKLARLRHDRRCQSQSCQQQQHLADLAVGNQRVDLENVECACGEKQYRHANEQADVADAVRQERLEGGVAVFALFPPVPDEHKRTDPDELPTDNHLENARRKHEEQHRCGEQAQERVEVNVTAVALDVGRRVDVHQERYQRDDDKKGYGQAVDVGTNFVFDAADLQPGDLSYDRIRVTASCGLLALGSLDGQQHRSVGVHSERRVAGASLLKVVGGGCQRTGHRLIGSVDPLGCRDERKHERDGDSGNAEVVHDCSTPDPFSENEDQEERDRERVFEHAITLSRASGRVLQHRCWNDSCR